KHVVFGYVVSGQSVVDTIEHIPIDSSNNRPLKDVVITHCGQLVLVSKTHKKKKHKTSTGNESKNEQGSESSSSSLEDDKKEKNKKRKKNEKHQQKKEAKRLAKVAADQENKLDQSTNNVNKEPTEISGRDIMGLKGVIDPDEIPEIPAHKFLMRGNSNDNNNDNNNNNNEASNNRDNNYRSSKKIDSSGRPVKGRGFMRYNGKSRSRSRTPPHWRSAVEDRRRFTDGNDFRKSNANENIEFNNRRRRIDDEKLDTNKEGRHSRRHERRKDDDRHHLSESILRHKTETKSISPNKNRTTTTTKYKENDTLNSPLYHRSCSPLPETDPYKKTFFGSRHHHQSPSTTDERQQTKTAQPHQQQSSRDQASARHHRGSKISPILRSRVCSSSPMIDQDEKNESRSCPRRSATPPPSSAVDQHQTKDSRRSKTPPVSSSRVRSASPNSNQLEAKDSRPLTHLSKTPPTSASPVHLPSPKADQFQNKDSRTIHRRSKTPPDSSHNHPSSLTIVYKQDVENSQIHHQNDTNIVGSKPSSTKRRKRWENDEEFNERQSIAQATQHASLEEELRMIAQTSAVQLEPSSYFVNIPQESQISTTVSKSKWDDEEDTSSKGKAHPPEITFDIAEKVDKPPSIGKQQEKTSSSYHRREKEPSYVRNRDRHSHERNRDRHNRENYSSQTSGGRYRHRDDYNSQQGGNRRRYSPRASSRDRHRDRNDQYR
ncbi:unnamed protein product, partial [Rotaria magnacalcarata]